MAPSWGRFAADALLVDVEMTANLSGTAIAAAPITVPAAQRWVVLWLALKWQASANVGSRALAWELRDASDVRLFATQNGISGGVLSQTASQHINWFYQSQNARDAAAVGGTAGLTHANQYFPGPFVLNAGQDIRFFDNGNVDGAGDLGRGSVGFLRLRV